LTFGAAMLGYKSHTTTMIIETTQKTIERSQQFEETSFKLEINENIFNILRNQIYTDKIGAVCREYMCNARDAHLLNGNTSKPIDVYAPSLENLEFRVRDYGTGLSKEDIFEIYVSYSKSLKRDDKNAIGYFGIGAKSGFAYTPSFQVISYYKGEKYIYNAYSSEDGVGKMALLVREPCEEESGMEIIIPVNISDLHIFIARIHDVAQFWNVKPNVHGDKDFKFDETEYHIESEGKWGFPKFLVYSSRRSKIIMGGIQYLIDPNLVSNANSLQLKMLNKGVYLFAELGQVSIPPSRETVEYTPKTISFIKAKLKEIENEIRERINKRLESINTEWEARSFYHEIFNESGELNIFKDIIKDTVKINFNNQEINSVAMKVPFPYFFACQRRNKQYKLTVRAGLNDESTDGYFIDFIGTAKEQSNKNASQTLFYTLKTKSVGKIRKIFSHHAESNNIINGDMVGKECLCFKLTEPNNLEQFKAFCDEKGMDFNLFKNIDDIQLPPRVKSSKTSNGSSSLIGYNAHVFDPENFLDEDEVGGQIISTKDGCLDTNLFNVDFDLSEAGYYLLRDGIEYEKFNHTFDFIHKELKKIDPEFSKHPVIYCFTERSIPKLIKNGWINIKDHLTKLYDEKFKDIKMDVILWYSYNFDYGTRDKVQNIIKLNHNCEIINKIKSLVTNDKQKCDLAKNNISLYGNLKPDNNIEKIIDKKKKEIEELQQKFLDSYPIMQYISYHSWDHKPVLDYISLVLGNKNLKNTK